MVLYIAANISYIVGAMLKFFEKFDLFRAVTFSFRGQNWVLCQLIHHKISLPSHTRL